MTYLIIKKNIKNQIKALILFWLIIFIKVIKAY
jgi:hypothetical protein